jgi:hypothetical protein
MRSFARSKLFGEMTMHDNVLLRALPLCSRRAIHAALQRNSVVRSDAGYVATTRYTKVVVEETLWRGRLYFGAMVKQCACP